MANAATKTVRGSQSCVWFTNKLLGRGAMGNVYEGRNRRKGDAYAVKVFNPELKTMTKDLIQIELNLLQSVPAHHNIVKLIAVEEETHSKDKVVIMELCEGGSLQQILDMPDNFYGMEEEEFLLVFFHIGEALKHLFEHHIVHRDVKPGNILLCILPDDSHVYKLTDFGASTTTGIDGFSDLSGTEEYLIMSSAANYTNRVHQVTPGWGWKLTEVLVSARLCLDNANVTELSCTEHPDMHRAAFVARVGERIYDATVDLWSYGTTVYQCATGKMPFEPMKGIRQDRRKMQKLMREKDSGVISQIEMPDGSNKISQTLPATCQLSSGTKQKVEEVLRQLFDLEIRIKPPDLFKQLEYIRSQVKIYAFLEERRNLITLYLNTNDTITHLKEEIALQADVPAVDQLLMLGDRELTDLDASEISDYPATSKEKPFMMIASSNISPPLVKYAQDSLPTLPQNVEDPDMFEDAKWARETCANIIVVELIIIRCIQDQWFLITLHNNFRTMLLRLCGHVDQELRRIDALIEIYRHIIHEPSASVSAILQTHEINRTEFQPLYSKTKDIIELFQPKCSVKHCSQKATKFSKEAKSLYQHIFDDKKKKLLHNEMEIHKFHKSELRRTFRRIRELAKNCTTEANILLVQTHSSISDMVIKYEDLVKLQISIKDYDHSVIPGIKRDISHWKEGTFGRQSQLAATPEMGSMQTRTASESLNKSLPCGLEDKNIVYREIARKNGEESHKKSDRITPEGWINNSNSYLLDNGISFNSGNKTLLVIEADDDCFRTGFSDFSFHECKSHIVRRLDSSSGWKRDVVDGKQSNCKYENGDDHVSCKSNCNQLQNRAEMLREHGPLNDMGSSLQGRGVSRPSVIYNSDCPAIKPTQSNESGYVTSVQHQGMQNAHEEAGHSSETLINLSGPSECLVASGVLSLQNYNEKDGMIYHSHPGNEDVGLCTKGVHTIHTGARPKEYASKCKNEESVGKDRFGCISSLPVSLQSTECQNQQSLNDSLESSLMLQEGSSSIQLGTKQALQRVHRNIAEMTSDLDKNTKHLKELAREVLNVDDSELNQLCLYDRQSVIN